MKLQKLFRNRFGHFRAGWRVLLFVSIVFVCFLPIAGLLKIWDILFPDKSGFDNSEDFSSLVNIVFLLGLNISIMIGSWVTLRRIDKRPYALLGLDVNFRAVKDFAGGFILGFINFMTIFIVLKLSGLIEIQLSNVNSHVITGMIRYFIVFFMATVFEELINRGYIFQALIEGTRIWISVLAISLVFVVGHSMNTGFAWNHSAYFLIRGVLYCTLYLLTRSLWVPIGFHFAWNWTQGSLFGLNVSGTEIRNSLFGCETRGPEILSGGDFGIEGSLISIVISILFIVFLVKFKWLQSDAFRIRLWHRYPAGFGLEPGSCDK